LNRAVFLFLLAAIAAPAEHLRVMSFNVRYPAPGDGPNRWELRRDLFIESIRAMDPDLMGTQELFHLQGEHIVARLPDYQWFGVSRRGNREDEHMGVFYKPSKLKVIESGNFWLSETPEVAGSQSWDMTLPRMVTWALFELAGSRKRFYYYNTHFAHRREDDAARLKSARLIVERASKIPAAVPFILTGDFNAPAAGEVHAEFARVWTDVWDKAPVRFGPTGTFNGFAGTSTGPRIDWIFVRGSVQPIQAHTVTLNEGGRYPSDHFPVFAVVDIR